MSADVALETIRDCLRSGLPSPLATCAPDGTPQISFVSRVQYLDSERVAVSRQAFNTGLAHLGVHPLSQVLVVRPGTGEEFRLDLRYLHTTTEGEEFDAMRAAFDALASGAGLGPAFRLRGVDVHRVLRCARVPRPSPAPPPVEAPDPLMMLERFAARLGEATSADEVRQQTFDALDDLLGVGFAVFFVPDAVTGRLVATAASRNARAAVGTDAAPTTGLIGTSAARRRLVLTGNLARLRAMAGTVEVDGPGIPLSGRAGPGSAAAVPLVVGRDLLGVLYLESAEPYALAGPVEALLRIVGVHTAAALAARGAAATRTRRAPAPVPGAGPPMELVHYRADDTVLCDSAYVVKGVPGRILWSMLEAHTTSGRTVFTNRELRLDESLELPVGNDNLEARLLVLRRRLAELGCGIGLERVGRGRLELRLDRPAELTVVPSIGLHARPAGAGTTPLPPRSGPLRPRR